ncbi:MAG: exodeoxyribonuclease VII small subunit [Acidobacteriota bacterium]|nr:MAG: exodeoxyribonuclease VII small subunit [Acidobacteriota bacterium]
MDKSFEELLGELEKIVASLEEGDQPLEQSLELFEKGVALSRECRARLENVERRIQVLIQKPDGEAAVEDIEVNDIGS